MRKLISGLLCVWAFMLYAEEQPAIVKDEPIPPGLKEYLGREIAATMHYEGAEWLIRESREREERATEMIAAMGLQAGMVVCDLGSGNGYHTLKLSRIVGETGKVYAVDIQPEMLRMLERRVEQAGVKNIIPVLGKLHTPNTPPGIFDLILLVDVYHEFSHPEHMLKEIHKGLKPEGHVVLVEFRAEDPKVPIKPLHKMSKRQIVRELTANDFKPVKSYDRLPWQHMLWFTRSTAEQSAIEIIESPKKSKP